MLPYIELFDKQIPLYGIFFYLGIALASICGIIICKRLGIERYDVVYSAVYSMIGAMIGSKLLFIAVSWETIMELKLSLVSVLKGGFVFYGGLIGGGIGLIIYCAQFKLPFGKFGDLYVAALPLGHAVGRIGCFFAGCCYGIPYDGPLAYTYHYTYGFTPLNVKLLPIQLIEAAVLMVIFAVGLAVYYRKNYRTYDQCLYYLCVYPLARFLLEYGRGDVERGSAGWFSTSQWVSLCLIGLSVLLFVLRSRKTALSAVSSEKVVEITD